MEAFTRVFKANFLITPSDSNGTHAEEIASPNGIHGDPAGRAVRLKIVFNKEESMELEKINAGPFRLLSFRHIGPYHEIGPVFGRLNGWAVEHGVPFIGAISIWYDDPESTPPHELRSDACLILPDGVVPPEVEGGPVYSEMPERRYAKATHMGPYEGLRDAWLRFCQAVAAQGLVTAPHPDFEWYVNDCAAVPPEEVQTDLYLPIQE